jgi:replicative DNA helicase
LGGLTLRDQEDSLALYSIERLVPEAFYSPEHKVIFKAILNMSASTGKPIDIITLSEYLQESGELENVGGMAYIGELINNTPSSANISAYADIIHKKYILRNIISAGTEMIDSSFNPEGKTPGEILDRAQQMVLSLSENGIKGTGPEDIKPIMARTITKINERCNKEGSVFGIETGFKEIDNLTTGLHEGQLIIIAARPAMGKTSFAMNIAEHASIKSGKCVLVFSMEMSSDDLMTRVFSSLGRIDQNKLRTGNMNDADWARMASVTKAMENAKLRIDPTPALSPMELRSRARKVMREEPLGLIVVDYLQLMQIPGHSENRTTEISTISRMIKALAKELNIPIIALSQLNRTSEGRPNKRPMMSDLRESGAIEQDADLIMMIYRDEVYNPDSPDKGTAELIVTKHRNGAIGMIRLTFVGHHTRFDNCMTSQGISSIE